LQVWEAETLEPRFSLQGFHKRGVCCLSFSPDDTRNLLVSVGMDDDHTVGVYSVDPQNRPGLLTCTAKGPKAKVGHRGDDGDDDEEEQEEQVEEKGIMWCGWQ
jgi:WD40 repeat protein